MAQKLKIKNKVLYQNLDKLFDEQPVQRLGTDDKWVIFSDLHMGDGGSTDDFKTNAQLFKTALQGYYANRNFKLLLNGDIEELQRFSMSKIMKHWPPIYELFNWFNKNTQLVKLIGNHDLELGLKDKNPLPYPHLESLTLQHDDQMLRIYHGHQASKRFQEHNELIGFTLKYFANPLGIKNYSVAHDSKKQYKIERRLYHYSAFRKVVSIIGHTHRPLFESLHKIERLKYKIEQLCRDYAFNQPSESIRQTIKSYKKELKQYYKANEAYSYDNYVYNTIFHIPCLFNSGCVIGKRGMTCLEIENGQIRLVHWFDKNISKKYLKNSGYQPEKLDNTDFYRMVINEETLDYIFTRIKFLT